MQQDNITIDSQKLLPKEFELSVCEDCYFYHHYDSDFFDAEQFDTSYLTKEDKQNIEDSFNEILKDYQIFDNYDSDNGPSFSWYSCDICNSRLAGNRFGLLQIEHNPSKTI